MTGIVSLLRQELEAEKKACSKLRQERDRLRAAVTTLNTHLDAYWNAGPHRHKDFLVKPICNAQQQCKEAMSDE